MDQIKILLVNKNYDDYGSSRPMLSLGYLSESLRAKNVTCAIMDLNLGYSSKNILERVLNFRPDLVGFSLFTNGFLQMNELIDQVKRQSPSIKIVVGGPHVSSVGKDVLKFNKNIDYGILNEGEYSLVELCEGKHPSKINGLMYYNSSGELFVNEQHFIHDLDSLPWPRYENFDLKKYIHELFIITSRGCPYKCIYCAVSKTLGRRIRYRSIENVIEEITYWYRKGRRIFNFVDDNLTYKYERVFELCDAIAAADMKDIVLRASNGIRADKTDKRMLKRMKEVGFKSLAIAVEGGNNRVLKLLQKGQTIEEIEDCIASATDLGLEISLSFVYGAPGETINDINDSVALAKKYKIFKVDFYNLVPYPGTTLWQWVEENNAWCVDDPLYLLSHQDKNLKFSISEGKPFFETSELSKEKKKKVRRMLGEVTMDIQKEGAKHLFDRLGLLKYPLAWLSSSMVFNRFFFQNNWFRRLTEKIRFRILRIG